MHIVDHLSESGRDSYELLVIGGRSGVGKSSVGSEVAFQLESAHVAHAYVEGDCMDWAYPWQPNLFHKNLTDFWKNYVAAGYRRLVYTNTASIGSAKDITKAMGGQTRVVGALLTCTDENARKRLSAREIGGALDWHLSRTEIVGKELATVTLPDWAVRVATDDRPVIDIARELIELTGWLD